MIDLRSDTVTRPSPEMLEAMANAETGDDVYGEDPTVNRLEAIAAEITEKESALFVSSGTQGNLLALLSHCQRGDEYIAGQEAHTYRFEAGGGAVLGGIQPQPVPFNDRGELALEEIRQVIKPDDHHFANTRLLCLENTQSGKVLSMDYLKSAAELARSFNLNLHLDGARIFNAAVKLNLNIKEICQYFDTVSICFSKGLAAPVGSILVGDGDIIGRARRWRKMVGGGMRQAGLLAAACIYALEHNIDRLVEDHRRTETLANCLNALPLFALEEQPQTNMLFLKLPDEVLERLGTWLLEHDVCIADSRWVLHRDISDADLYRIMELCTEFNDRVLA